VALGLAIRRLATTRGGCGGAIRQGGGGAGGASRAHARIWGRKGAGGSWIALAYPPPSGSARVAALSVAWYKDVSFGRLVVAYW
jgi:hypothetical protein